MLSTGDILVVDDEPSIVGFIAEVLTEEGYIVSSALNSADARVAFAQRQPDLVLLDLHLPGEAGDVLAHDLKNAGLGDVPIIIMTADSQAAHKVSMGDIAFCLMKPFDLDDLLDCVAKYTRQHQIAMS